MPDLGRARRAGSCPALVVFGSDRARRARDRLGRRGACAARPGPVPRPRGPRSRGRRARAPRRRGRRSSSSRSGSPGPSTAAIAPVSLRRARITAQHVRDACFEEYRALGVAAASSPAEVRRGSARIERKVADAIAVIGRARTEHDAWMHANVSAAAQVEAARGRLDGAAGDDGRSRVDCSPTCRRATPTTSGARPRMRRSPRAPRRQRPNASSRDAGAAAADPTRSGLADLASAERSLRQAEADARTLEETHRLVTQAAQARAGRIRGRAHGPAQRRGDPRAARTRSMRSVSAREIRAVQTRARRSRTRLRAAAHHTVDRIARLRDRLDLALGDARTAQQRLRGARTALPGTLAAARGAIARAEASVAHARAGAPARLRLLSAQRELAEARQAADPVEALDAARRAMRDAEDAELPSPITTGSAARPDTLVRSLAETTDRRDHRVRRVRSSGFARNRWFRQREGVPAQPRRAGVQVERRAALSWRHDRGAGTPRTTPVRRVMWRIPATLVTVFVMSSQASRGRACGVPFEDSSTYDLVAYGLPALSAGRWWTPFTGTFFVNVPWVYVFALGGFVGMAYVEFRRGWRARARLVLDRAAVRGPRQCARAARPGARCPGRGRRRRRRRSMSGPSGGTMACIAVAVGLLVQPWRVRAWLVLLGFVFVALTFWGALADLEHALAVLLVLFVDRTLRIQRTTIREQRLIAFIAVLVIAAIELITLLVPTDGMFGPTDAAATSFIDVALDVGVILLLANGLRRGRRWAWGWTVGYAIFNIHRGALLVVIVATGLAARSDVSIVGLGVSIATTVLWLLLLVYLIAVRHAFRARRKSPLGAQPPPDRCRGASDAPPSRRRRHPVVDDDVGRQQLRPRRGEHHRLSAPGRGRTRPGRSDRTGARAISRDRGLHRRRGARGTRALLLQRERADATGGAARDGAASSSRTTPIVDLPGLEFTGKRWSAVRTAINRAAREQVVFRMSRFADEPWGVRQQLRAISEMWVGDKGLPEMGFTLGTLDEAEDPEVRLALAVSTGGGCRGLPVLAPGVPAARGRCAAGRSTSCDAATAASGP